jgi:periplasmic protein TonB
MGDLILKISRPAPRRNRTAGDQSAKHRDEQPYNRSSLALEMDSEPFSAAWAAGPSIPRQSGVMRSVSRNTMFRGLDQRIARRRRGTTVVSVFLHAVAFAVVLAWGAMVHNPVVQTTETTAVPLHFTLYDPPPPPVMPVAKQRGGGGGGGAHHVVAPSRGKLPEVVKAPIVLSQISRVERPKLPVEPSVQMRMPQDNSIPKLGMPQSPQVAVESQGPGSGNGFGFGLGGGVGTGHGTGQGPGSTGGYGGGVMNVGGGVSAPEVIHSVQPQFTAEARQKDFQGSVAIQLIVDAQGAPQDVRVVRRVGMGLDEEAIAAVKQYRFRPATYQGHAVAVQMIIDIDFHLH